MLHVVLIAGLQLKGLQVVSTCIVRLVVPTFAMNVETNCITPTMEHIIVGKKGKH